MKLYYISFYNNPCDSEWSFEVCAAKNEKEARKIVSDFIKKEHDMDIEENGIREVYPLACCNAYDIKVTPINPEYRHSYPV